MTTKTNLGVQQVTKSPCVVTNIIALRAQLKDAQSTVQTLGYYSAGDGGGGLYRYESSDTSSTDNGGTTIVATDGGRWKLVLASVVNVKSFGAKGDGTSDDTSFVQSAVNQLSRPLPDVHGKPVTIFFPEGFYRLTDTISLPGAICILGEGGLSYAGTILRQETLNKDLFKVTSTGNFACEIRNVLLKNGAGSGSGYLFNCPGTVPSANSLYFERVWFQLPESYAFNIEKCDDTQFVNCTFDVTAFRWGKIGTASYQCSNFVITGCTFYAGFSNLGCVDVINVANLLVTNNRVYGGGFRIPYFINATFAPVCYGITVQGNTSDQVDVLVQANKIVNVSNNYVSNGGLLVALSGGTPIYGVTVVGNTFTGATSIVTPNVGIIDATGTPVVDSVVSDNVLIGNSGGTSPYGINFPHASSISNRLKNVIDGCTAKYNVTSGVNNGLDLDIKSSFGGWSPVVAAGASVTNTIAVAGLRNTDMVHLSPYSTDVVPAGVSLSWVTSTNTITLRYRNMTASSITVPSQDYLVSVVRPDSLA
jgi:hypothetical protein